MNVILVSDIKEEDLLPEDGFAEVNTMECRVWNFYDSENLKETTLNWDSLNYPRHTEITFKEVLRALHGASMRVSGPLYGRTKTIKNRVTALKKIFNSKTKIFGSDTLFGTLSLNNFASIVQDIATKHNGELWTGGTVEQAIAILKKMKDYSRQEKITDGIKCDFPKKKITDCFLKAYVESKGVCYNKWLTRGTWHNLHIDVALLFLNDMLEIMESPTANFLVDYFKFQRSQYSVVVSDFSRPGAFKQVFLDAVEEVVSNHSASTKSNIHRLAKLFSDHGFMDQENDDIHFYSGMFTDEGNVIKGACLVVFTILSGGRISEVNSVRFAGMEVKNNEAYFYSRLKKNDNGMGRKRSCSKNALNAINVASNISYLSPQEDVSPFSSTHLPSVQKALKKQKRHLPSAETTAKRITRIYERWAKDKSEIDGIPETSSPHALRHVFAAIALYRFKGNVRESIRRHFGHSNESNFTKSYVKNKLDEEIISAAESGYFKELAYEISSDDPEFYAAVIKRIRERVSEEHVFKSINEVGDYIAEQALDSMIITGHEFGYSVSWLEDEAITTDLHHLSADSGCAEIVRIGIHHQNLIDNISDPVVREASSNIVSICEYMLEELEVNLEELDYE